MTSIVKPTLSAAEAAAALGISLNSFYAHHAAGRIASLRLGKKILVRREEIDRILQAGLPTTPAPAADTTPVSPLD